MRSKKSLRSVVRTLRQISETLEPDQRTLLLMAMRKLEHGLAVGNLREVDAAITKVARVFLANDWPTTRNS